MRRAAAACGIESFGRAGIRELRRLVDRLEAETGLVFIRMEVRAPGLPPPAEAVQAEIKALENGVGGSYPHSRESLGSRPKSPGLSASSATFALLPEIAIRSRASVAAGGRRKATPAEPRPPGSGRMRPDS